MDLLLFLAALFLAAILTASYWGAGNILYPPNMSAMTVFPERFGVAYEKVSFRAADGQELRGWFIASAVAGTKTILFCHGWGDNKGELLERTLFLRDEGFNLFYFDFRGHGESAPSVVTMGKLELLDLAAAMRYLREAKPRHAANLAVYGQSMGAAVLAMGLARYPEIRAAVLESPFADYREVVGRWAWSQARVPYFPTIYLLMRWARLRSGHFDIDAHHPELLIASARTPALFIAAERDTLAPPRDVRRVYARAQGPKDLWIVPGAQHAKCRLSAPAEYDRRVARFLRLHLAGPEAAPELDGALTGI